VPISIDYQNIYSYFRHAQISDIINTNLMKLFIESILLQLSIENSIKRLSSDRLWSIVQNVTHFLTNNYYENITHELLEEKFCYSYVHLNRIYKQYTKETIFKQLEMIRIKVAEEKILMGQQIKNITREVGYDDYYYFLKKFKKITGLTPKEFYKKYFSK
jgi:YesN/AraC family two-component response regulator